MRFAELAATSAAVAAIRGRRAKVALLADALGGLKPDEVEAGAAYLAGELRQRQIGVGWASLRDLPAPADQPVLEVRDVDNLLAKIGGQSGPGSQARRRELLGGLFAAATADEQRLLAGLISGELRQGAQAGLLVDAIARAAEVDVAAVRRALLLAGDLKVVARAALTGGQAALGEFRLRVGRPLAPMLAQAAPTIDEALAATGYPAVVDTKLDGIRIQVHRSGDDIGVYSRSLDDITRRVPEIVAAVRALPTRELVLDGELIALDATGRPRPFQETSSRAARRADTSTALTPYFFDLLHVDGEDLVDQPGARRWSVLREVLPDELLVPRTEVSTVEEGLAAFERSLAMGHEGVVIKAAGVPYDVGRRGSGWVKVKPRHTLDLVILAAEWGHGRRRGWLSNLHLGARDPAGGGFVMLGKTFKGLTDEMLRWQTERLLALAVDSPVGHGPAGGGEAVSAEWVVRVRPELVVEIAFDGVQASPRYPGGVALRFARVLRYREDKPASDADTIEAVRRLHIADNERT